jgi:hypothetical protein
MLTVELYENHEQNTNSGVVKKCYISSIILSRKVGVLKIEILAILIVWARTDKSI